MRIYNFLNLPALVFTLSIYAWCYITLLFKYIHWCRLYAQNSISIWPLRWMCQNAWIGKGVWLGWLILYTGAIMFYWFLHFCFHWVSHASIYLIMILKHSQKLNPIKCNAFILPIKLNAFQNNTVHNDITVTTVYPICVNRDFRSHKIQVGTIVSFPAGSCGEGLNTNTNSYRRG